MEINGIAHIMLTVSNLDACLPFYEQLLAFLGLKTVLKTDGMLYCVGGRTAVGIMQAEEQHRGQRFVQRRVGLHHVCFRARERASRCYSVLFEDPDGIRLEMNHVPGKGLLADVSGDK